MERTVALLRGVNVGGNRKLSMEALREVAEGCDLAGVRSYIQSGNLVFDAPCDAAECEQRLERAIAARFGFPVEVCARSVRSWKKYLRSDVFAEAARERPSFLHLALSKAPPKKGAVAELEARATFGERVRVVGDGIFIDFCGGVGRSKLTPAVLDRAIGSTVTARNWKTVLALSEMLDAG